MITFHDLAWSQAYQPRRLPFWSIGDAARRITRLLATRPDGAELGAFLPKIAGTGADRALHAGAAVAATLMAALELSRNGALTLQQAAPWQPIRAQRQDGGACDTLPGPAKEGDPALA